MTARAPLARFDGAARWAGLTPEQQAEIGAIALEIVAAWLAMPGPGDVQVTAVSRAAEEGASRLTSGLVDRVTDLLGLGAFRAGRNPALPSLLGPICRACGCTSEDACWTEHGPCGWAADDLCTGCAGGSAP